MLIFCFFPIQPAFVDSLKTFLFPHICTRPISDGTKATYLRNAKVFLNWACQEGYNQHIDVSRLRVPRMPKKVVRIYTPAEVKMIFDAVDSSGAPWMYVRNCAIILSMYDSGLRQEEVCTLERKCVSFEEHNMLIKGKGGKERYVPLGQTTEDAFRTYLDACPYGSDFFFLNRNGTPMTTNSVRLMVLRINRKLPFDLSSHKLRHNFGTNYCIDQMKIRGKVDIYSLMYIMGHEDIKTTQRYLHFATKILATRDHLSHLDLILQK